MEQKNKDNKKPIREGVNKFVRFSTLAFEMGIIIGGGTYGGVYLDDYFELNTPVFTIVLSLFAVFASLYLVIKQVNNVNKD
ncbi:MAG: AtpZ/AtpI family protein [Bacteroidales bacterium]|jgi:F0F1-type ATP synthase assembly protein I|nr:AtpZ/AtpI family protein [Bacteroidales bacterium]MDD4215733.1 AtpZ/AtpI family protein [Bacteroidales bacterium]MDY0140340.1 AtpZ/AtpI family protein [Bacteroidales bacterium]